VKFIPHWGMERARIMKVIFDNNSFVGISIETYNRREYVIKSENGVETYYVERVGSFLSEHFDFANQIFTSDFFEAQKHLKLNAGHQYDALDVLKVSAPKIISEWEAAYEFESTHAVGALYLIYRNDRQYFVAEKDMISQISFIINYLNELYAAGMFPRKCMRCGSLFLSGKRHGNVLCSDECRKKKKVQNTIHYYSVCSENEKLYLKIYRKWKEREHRAADNHSISESGLEQLDWKLKQLIVMHRECAYRREEGRLNEADWAAALENYDNELYELWDNIKSHKCPTGEPTGGK